MKDRYSQLTRAAPTSKPSSTHMVDILIDSYIVLFGIPVFVLTDNGPHYVSKLFAMLFADLGVKHLTTTAYHQQNNGLAERFNRAIVKHLRHYVADDQRKRDASYIHLPTRITLRGIEIRAHRHKA